MKKLILLLLIGISTIVTSQEKYFTKSGNITFESSVKSFEEVKAVNNKVTTILKDDGTIASLALIKAFKFKIALMEEHFNENYMNSENFPKAKFTGKINNFSIDKLSERNTEYNIEGTLTIKGISKNMNITCNIKLKNNNIFLHSHFKIKPEDFGIEIPSIVRKKIAKKIDMLLNFELKKK